MPRVREHTLQQGDRVLCYADGIIEEYVSDGEPPDLDGDEWDHLTDAIDLYTRARIERRLEQMRERTVATREALLPPTSPLLQQPQPGSNNPGNRPPTPR
ncbi:hypothetical protein [Streptomyces sp. NPDC002133]|uniref:hypothetical protein n=1 Tax=Streptomyces sp. NPDC002133 TaxID=3154409 RepID=UPI00331C09FF